MSRLSHPCFIAVCLTGCLLLMQLCCDCLEYEYDSNYNYTETPDYDYNFTIVYSFFSNDSSEDWDVLITENDLETETVGVDKESKVFNNNQVLKAEFPSLLLTGVLTAHQFLRIL